MNTEIDSGVCTVFSLQWALWVWTVVLITAQMLFFIPGLDIIYQILAVVMFLVFWNQEIQMSTFQCWVSDPHESHKDGTQCVNVVMVINKKMAYACLWRCFWFKEKIIIINILNLVPLSPFLFLKYVFTCFSLSYFTAVLPQCENKEPHNMWGTFNCSSAG